jgi:hypothetical protein
VHPPIQGHVVDLDATLGEKFFEVPVGQPVAEVPAHRHQDHLGRETETSEPRRHPHRRHRTASALHRATLTATVRSVNATEPSCVGTCSSALSRCPSQPRRNGSARTSTYSGSSWTSMRWPTSLVSGDPTDGCLAATRTSTRRCNAALAPPAPCSNFAAIRTAAAGSLRGLARPHLAPTAPRASHGHRQPVRVRHPVPQGASHRRH